MTNKTTEPSRKLELQYLRIIDESIRRVQGKMLTMEESIRRLQGMLITVEIIIVLTFVISIVTLIIVLT